MTTDELASIAADPRRIGSKRLDPSPTSPDVVRLSRDWLTDRPKDELIDLILDLKGRLTKLSERTSQLYSQADSMAGALPVTIKAEDLDVKEFVRLPSTPKRKSQDDKSVVSWRIILLSGQRSPLGLDIYDDVFVGREVGGIEPDLDLSVYGAGPLGVSRQHALLRPSQNGLFLIDLGSTNGTFYNGQRLREGVPQKLKDNDTLTFGRLHFNIKFADQPDKNAG